MNARWKMARMGPPGGCGRREGARGFSMAEILVVLFILALGSTIALYSYANYRKSLTVQTSARKFQAVLSQARGRAINFNLPNQVTVDLDSESFWVDELNSTRTDYKAKVIPEEKVSEFVIIEQLQIGSSTFTSGIHAIVFEPDGTSPFVVVHMRREFDDPSQDENYYSVRMYPSSGEPQVLPKQRI
ncbi:prepilin-type N-terminal cleavage/methylation domain-containing protein [Candidatus Poribacteria bacterium]|nr:prepilin-type N-terminal cleavage/methylation domain-containing protein [Candidatus Poribacteria bacterium]